VGSLYRLPHARFRADMVYTNSPVTGAMRGFGNPQSTFFVEMGMDQAAEAIGMDPLSFRVQNANRPNEETSQGLKITTCGLRECLIDVGERLDWSRRGRRFTDAGEPVTEERARFSPLRAGLGVASTLNVGGGARIYRSDGCGATVKIDDFGRVVVTTGATEIGQGADVVLTQIVAEVLGVRLEDVTVINGDTALTLWDVGTHASRTTFIAGNAAKMAAEEARGQILAFAAGLLGAPADRLTIKDGLVLVVDNHERAMSLDKVVRRLHLRQGGSVVTAQAWYDPDTQMIDKESYMGNMSMTYGFGAHAVEVEVDTGSGQVTVKRIVATHDAGRIINPLYAEAQIEGGIQMGLGYALMEELIVKDGRVLNDEFHNYRLARSLDMPRIETVFVETDDPTGPYGAKGLGEMGVNPVAAAIANAIYDAVGVRVTSLPITPEKILRALDEQSR
jgi:CO/xanthine dehydrogenase Mo-binding subunit